MPPKDEENRFANFHMVIQAEDREDLVDVLNEMKIHEIFTGPWGWREIWLQYNDGDKNMWQVTVNQG